MKEMFIFVVQFTSHASCFSLGFVCFRQL